jgi:deoxyguanosine kinase
MSASYLQQLIEDYERAMELFQFVHPHIPIIRLNGDDLDFVMNEQDLETILGTVESTVKGRAAL